MSFSLSSVPLYPCLSISAKEGLSPAKGKVRGGSVATDHASFPHVLFSVPLVLEGWIDLSFFNRRHKRKGHFRSGALVRRQFRDLGKQAGALGQADLAGRLQHVEIGLQGDVGIADDRAQIRPMVVQCQPLFGFQI